MSKDASQLIFDLASDDAAVRVSAVQELAKRQGDDARAAAVALVRAAGDSDEEVRNWAASTLEEMEAPSGGDVEELAKLLADNNADIAYWAATLIGRLAASGRQDASAAGHAVDSLAAALDASRPVNVRQQAAMALARIGPPAAASAKTALAKAAEDDDPRLQRMAGRALSQLELE